MDCLEMLIAGGGLKAVQAPGGAGADPLMEVCAGGREPLAPGGGWGSPWGYGATGGAVLGCRPPEQGGLLGQAGPDSAPGGPPAPWISRG